jgi:broad specificity phosphatase PhoE
MMKIFYAAFLLIASFCTLESAVAMPGKDHDALARLLLDSPISKGGSKGLSESQVRAISEWMDNPTQNIGKQRIQGLEEKPKVTPGNHQHLRHNPERAARALSGTRTINPAVLNQARVHKIADVAVSKASGVDGWELTPKMKKQAQNLIQYIEKHKRLPTRLPTWVDASGPLLTDRALAQAASAANKGAKSGVIVADDVLRSSVEAAEQTSKLMTVTKGAGKVAKVAGPIALVIEAGVRGKSAYDTEQDYERGDISDDERVIRHARNGGQLAGGVAGAAGGAWAGAAAGACTGPAAPVCVPVFAVAGGIAGGLGGDALGGNCAAYIAEKRTQIRQRTHELKVHVEQEILEIEQDWNDLKGRCQHMFSKGS